MPRRHTDIASRLDHPASDRRTGSDRGGIDRNEPRLEVRDDSHIPNGAFILDIDGDALKRSSLREHYWTDRDSRGEFIAERIATYTR